ncbi:lysostaphin resistance A-like protein [Microbacterium sp. A93]|uniref:CPBP family intramembrane glutamic endopeptidase n=1 Tax=Microbacterium sp. A93 TaxID=3450716 RepID=UPI003F42672E
MSSHNATKELVADAATLRRASAKRWAIGLPVLRIGLVAAASTLTWLIVSAFESVTFPPPPMIAVVAMLPVNIICLLLVARLLRRDGRSIRDVLGFEPRRILRDLLWGLLWLIVMYLPFSGTIMLVVWAQHGDELFIQMETVFVDPSAIPTLNPVVWSIIGVVGALTFAPLNAPVEELVYRGYAQGTLARRWPTVLAIVVPSILFALQHVWYAPTPGATVAFVCAFFVWGVCSGLIYLRQRRLMPLVFAHGLVNLLFTLPALAMPFLLTQNGF